MRARAYNDPHQSSTPPQNQHQNGTPVERVFNSTRIQIQTPPDLMLIFSLPPDFDPKSANLDHILAFQGVEMRLSWVSGPANPLFEHIFADPGPRNPCF